jgi:hypothetical protein
LVEIEAVTLWATCFGTSAVLSEGAADGATVGQAETRAAHRGTFSIGKQKATYRTTFDDLEASPG